VRSKKVAALFAATMVVALCAAPASAASTGGDEAVDPLEEHVADQAIVGFSDRREAEDVVDASGGHVEQAFRSMKLMVVDTPTPAAEWVESFQHEVAAEASVDFVQLDYIVEADTHVASDTDPSGPNDPGWSSLYGMQAIGVEEAWHTNPGSEDIVVGVVDTGIDYTHPDLNDQMWTNPDEIGSNGIDDDSNGWVDDVHGADCTNNDGNPMDDHSHGTHVAGTIAATANNGTGVAGVADTSLMALKFLGSDGSGATSDAIQCLDYAIRNGAHLTNNSWGGSGSSSGLSLAIDRAAADNQLFIAAAGNSGLDNDSTPHYPSSYPQDNVISVAATDSNDALASFSNYGAASVDIAAPGVGILSTVPGGSYKSYSGTSMATPHVAGVAALLLAQDPNASYSSVRDRLFATLDPMLHLEGKMVHPGRLNAARALGPPATSTPSPAPTTPEDVPTTPTDEAPAAPAGLTATAGIDTVSLDWADNADADLKSYKVFRRSSGATEFEERGTVTASSFLDQGVAPGTYMYLVRAYDLADQASLPSSEASVTVPKLVQKKSFVPMSAAPIYGMGRLERGSYLDLASDNGRYYTIRSVRQSDRRTYTANWETTTRLTGVTDATKLSLTFDGRLSSSEATQRISVRKTGGGWETLHVFSGTSRDRTVSWTTETPALYISGESLILRVESSRPGSGFYSYGDYVRWDVEF
jgi:subtilisin family serine protease